MKSQDIVVLFKLASLDLAERRVAERRQRDIEQGLAAKLFDWYGWEPVEESEFGAEEAKSKDDRSAERYSVRGLAASLGINKNEVSASLNRSVDADLLRRERVTRHLRVNNRVLLDLAEHCLRYVFPVKPGPLMRGIPTGFAAPVLADDIASAGETIPVWPYARGSRLGQSVLPLHRAVPEAVQKDQDLYAMLALVDALRLGNPRERTAARQRLEQILDVL
ncbi:MAG: hypothetical protein JZU52_06580 [Lamprocystis purpurea]|jgi:hypothetical protein|uniref:hypothetical protein n=1 Tax=Lamprocystis purpurea TaxID=61598 RepID=UPI00035D2850|nr:hypothetical protein [Lamprocystis purpurea]MBV5273308.1 hypothetical protein [Lamprocystis purpurea]